MIPLPNPNLVEGLRVLSRHDAALAGFQSITTGISRTLESGILRSVAARRNPQRAVWISIDMDRLELALKREDIATD